MWFLIILVAIPIVEIALFIEVGDWIGLWPTLGLVALSALVGMAIVRTQGLRTLPRLLGRIRTGEDPRGVLADGALVLVAGAALLLPGFFTDAIGVALLVPRIRSALIDFAAARIRTKANVRAHGAQRWSGSSPRDVIEADYEVLDDVPPSERGASGGRRPRS